MSTSKDDTTALMEGILVPKKYVGGLSNKEGIPTFTKLVSGKTTFNSTKKPTGLIVWPTKRGYNAIFVCTVLENAAAFTPITFSETYQLPAKLVVPDSDADVALTVEPDIAADISVGRLVSALLHLRSDSTNGGNLPFNGNCAVAAIADFRDLNTFTQDDLTQHAVTNKDGISDIQMLRGACAVIGPDIDPELRPIDRFKAMDPAFQGVFESEQPALTGTQKCFFYGINGVTATKDPLFGTTTPADIININVGRVPGWLQGNFWVSIQNDTVGAIIPKIIHVYVTRFAVAEPFNASGQLSCRYETAGGRQDNGGATLLTDAYSTFEMSIRPRKNEFYLGTWVYPSASTGSISNSGTHRALVTFDNLYGPETISSLRVFQWDGFDTTTVQSVTIGYEAMVEGVATGGIAPYVKATSSTNTADAYSLLPCLQHIFNDPASAFARVYDYEQWQLAFARPTASGVQDVIEDLSASGKLNTKSGYCSAGALTNIGGILGSSFGPLGGLVGSALGGIGDALFGAGSLRASGKMRSAGMLQSSRLNGAGMLQGAGMLSSAGNLILSDRKVESKPVSTFASMGMRV